MAADANRRVGRGKARNRKARRARQAQATCPTSSVAPQHFVTMPSPATFTRGSRNYIGRVGALAVALGVGVLVTTGQGLSVARAQTGTDSSSAPSAEGSPDAGAGGATGTATGPPADADPPPPGPSTAPASPTDAGADSPTTAGESTAPQMDLDSSGGLDTSTNDAGQATDDEIPPASTEPEVDAAAAAGTESDGESVGAEGSGAQHDSLAEESTPIDTASTADSGGSAQESDADLMDTADAAGGGDDSLVPLTLMSIADDPVTGDEQGFAAFTRQASTVSEVEAIPTVAQDPIQTFVGVITTGLVSAATTIVNLLLSPFLAASPLGPAQPLTLWEVLGSLVRQVRYSYFNDAPVVPDQDITLVLGPTEVSGPISFLASDPDGDRLIYEVVENRRTDGPQHGTVTIDQATGTFTYDPDDGYTGPDEFTVEVSDHTTLHFHGLRSLLFGRSHTDTATIRLTVIAANDPNDAPDAVDDSRFSTPEDTPAVIQAAETAGQRHRRHPDHHRGRAARSAAPCLPGRHRHHLHPDPQLRRPDTFTYTIDDAAGLTDTAHGDRSPSPPSTTPRSPSTTPTPSAEDGTLTVGASGVLGNDTDADPATPCTITAITGRATRHPDPQPPTARSPTPPTPTSPAPTPSPTPSPTPPGSPISPPSPSPSPQRQRRPGRRRRHRHRRRGLADATVIDVLANDTDPDAGDTLTVTAVDPPATAP